MGPVTMPENELDQYQADALRTWSSKELLRMRRLNALLGLCGESGELADAVKKWAFHGHPLPQGDVANELGDILWYVAVIAQEFNLSLADVATRNIAKLKERYPEGFSEADSLLRRDVPGMAFDENGKAKHYDRS